MLQNKKKNYKTTHTMKEIPFDMEILSNKKVTGNDYTDAYKTPVNLSIKQEPKVKYTYNNHYVYISSSHRDTSLYPLHYDYKIDFKTPYRNIKSVKLVSVTIPEFNLSTEPVISFDLDGLNHIEYCTKNGNYNIFSVHSISQSFKTGHSFITLKEENQQLEFKTPLGLLSNLRVKLYNIDYEPMTWGAPLGSVDKLYQHSFMLKITTEETSTEDIKYRKTSRDS